MNKKILSFVLAAMMVMSLAACSAKEVPAPSTEATTAPTTEAPTTAPTTEATTAPTTEAPTEAPAEPQILNPLNGSDAPMNNRAVAVMFNNAPAALPQCGTSHADILFEVIADNCGVTRLVGIFSDITTADTLGSVRSARPYTFSIARSFDALYVHFGGSPEAEQFIHAAGWDEMNGTGWAGNYFYRNQDRLNAGYAWEHTAFTDSESVMQFLEDTKTRYEQKETPAYGFVFDNGMMEGEAATDVYIHFGEFQKTTTLKYDPDTGLYTAYQYGDPFEDGAAGENLTFRNVIHMEAPCYPHSDGVHAVYDLIREGDATLIRDGVQVPIRWYRDYEDDCFHFTYEDGTVVSLGVGHTYIAITPMENNSYYE